MPKIRAVLFGGVVLTYPLLVYLGLARFGARWIGLAALVLVGVRFCLVAGHTTRKHAKEMAVRLVPLLVLWSAAALTGDQRLLLFVPALGSWYMCALLVGSMRAGHVSWIERLARMIHGMETLPPTAVRHCQRVTGLWAGFLFLNGLVSGALAMWGPIGWWALYTGLLAYIVMGILMGSEYLYRIRLVRPIADSEAIELGLLPAKQEDAAGTG